jgi:uncharacterized membrane protein YqaE (UPF0057 family)
MKRALFILVISLFTAVSGFAAGEKAASVAFANVSEVSALPAELSSMTPAALTELTPASYEKMTGKKLGVKNALALRAAQKAIKKHSAPNADIEKGVYILLAILGLGFLAIGLLDNWSGSDWIIALVLSILCWLPGVIYAFVKMKNYYS